MQRITIQFQRNQRANEVEVSAPGDFKLKVEQGSRAFFGGSHETIEISVTTNTERVKPESYLITSGAERSTSESEDGGDSMIDSDWAGPFPNPEA